MKPILRKLSFALVLLILMSCVGILFTGADNEGNEARYTQKIVSVLYDNSGSMSNGDHRNEYAKYAMQFLMALLNKNDVLVVTPMNKNGSKVTSTDAGVVVDLAAPNRATEINRVMSSSVFTSTPRGGTPPESIGIAVDQLEERGLKDKDHLANADENKEYWVVILTDGAFDDKNAAYAAEKITKYVEDFPSLRTMYFGLGGQSHDLTSYGLDKKFPFSHFRAGTADGIVEEMKKIANALSGRYTLDDSYYAVDGKKVTIDLDKCDFSSKTISVIAQNCGAELVSAKYKGQTIPISAPCTISPNSVLNLKNSFSAVMEGSPYFYGGKMELEFSAQITKNDLNIMMEPALHIVPYVEYHNGSAWERTTMQFINANLSENDKIRVGYEAYEQATGQQINLSKIFGEAVSSVTYAKGAYQVGQEMPLVVGNNEVTISVSLMNGAYTMYASMRCIIERNPTYFRIEAEHGDDIPYFEGKANASFKVYADNNMLNAAALSKYTWTVSAVAPDGSAADVVASADQSGKINAVINAKSGCFGEYKVKCHVVSPEEMTRSCEFVLKYTLGSYSIECNGSDEIESDTQSAVYELKVLGEGKQLTKAELSYCELLLVLISENGQSSDVPYTIDNNGKINATVDAAHLAYGKYKLKATLKAFNEVQAELEKDIRKECGKYEIECSGPDEIGTGDSSVTYEFKIREDGVVITKKQLERFEFILTFLNEAGEARNVTYTVTDDGVIKAVIDTSGCAYGYYELKASLMEFGSTQKELAKPIKKFPGTISVAVKGEDRLVMTQHQFGSNDSGLTFELTTDGVPYDFAGKLITYKVLCGGVDVTQYATVEGNLLTYIPVLEHLGGSIKVGDTQIEVLIECSERPSLNTSAAGTLSITETVYLIKSLDIGNRDIDRFDLKNIDAAIYFTVYRDGIMLTAEELEAALASGELSITDEKGTFGWKFWLPCGSETYVETVDGVAAVVFRATKDWIQPFHSFAAMMIFNGDRPITAVYGNASLSENLFFLSSHWWSYVWRILVILFVIHCILYIIGFFNGKCKSLPSGVIVIIPLKKEAPMQNVRISEEWINENFWKRYSWHILRFFPHNRHLWWYNQPAKKIKGNFTFKYEEGEPCFVFDNEETRICTYARTGSTAATDFNNYIVNLTPKIKPTIKITNADVRKIVRIQKTLIPRQTCIDYTTPCVSFHKDIENPKNPKFPKRIIIFVEKN